MSRPTERATERNGLGIVILAIVLALCLLARTWTKAALVANVLGPAAYGIALGTSAVAACIAALIFKSESFADEPVQLEAVRATVEVGSRSDGARLC